MPVRALLDRLRWDVRRRLSHDTLQSLSHSSGGAAHAGYSMDGMAWGSVELEPGSGIEWKRTNEVDPIRLRPHPHEFELYYDV